MEANELIEPFARLLDDAASPRTVRDIEAGGDWSCLWEAISGSGFLDALVAEEHGGAGLSLAQAAPLFELLGARAMPLPVAETMVARALLARAGQAAPAGPIVLATTLGHPVPGALVAGHALAEEGSHMVLAPLAGSGLRPTGVHGSLAAVLATVPRSASMPAPVTGLRAVAAVVRAALIAGAAARVCEMAVTHASQRVQFGKPIGRQQALQQMMAVMAQDMVACRIAARLACAGGLGVNQTLAATAKITASAAAARVAASGHAVHGAIGIAEEYDLQLLTRRLHEWRLADGSETFWAARLGAQRIEGEGSSVDWVRLRVFAS